MNVDNQKDIIIEIWSDIACPFCFIGKHKIENAISKSSHHNRIELIWRSYQLNPKLITDKTKNIYQSLSENKGISIEVAKQMSTSVIPLGKENDIQFNFDDIVPANTSKAHQLLHFSKQYGKQTAAKSLLFEAYFTEGKNIDDMLVLSRIVTQLQLNTSDFVDAILSGSLLPEVEFDQFQAQQMGVKGVPFFLFNNTFIVAGAQPQIVFENTLQNTINVFLKTINEANYDNQDGTYCNNLNS
jgi:predicted DsbA family dithiol-disulfide isomerase